MFRFTTQSLLCSGLRHSRFSSSLQLFSFTYRFPERDNPGLVFLAIALSRGFIKPGVSQHWHSRTVLVSYLGRSQSQHTTCSYSETDSGFIKKLVASLTATFPTLDFFLPIPALPRSRLFLETWGNSWPVYSSVTSREPQ